MAHRVFRSFPSPDEIANRIDEFLARLSRGETSLALSLCPIEGLARSDRTDGELAEAVRDRCFGGLKNDSNVADWIAGLGHVARRAGLSLFRGDDEVVVRVPLDGRTDVAARFVLTESDGDRWTLWFDRFEPA